MPDNMKSRRAVTPRSAMQTAQRAAIQPSAMQTAQRAAVQPGMQTAQRAAVRKGKGDRTHSRAIPILIVVLLLSFAAMVFLLSALKKQNDSILAAYAAEEDEIEYRRTLLAIADAQTSEILPIAEPKTARAVYAADAKTLDSIKSAYAILIDVDNNTVLASRDGEARIYPASMTKLMTLIVAMEHMADLDDTYTFTYQIINPQVEAGASVAGFSVGETVPLIDLLYGTALPSGADATAAIADYVAGSESLFAELMNEKAAAMGLVNTHFVNASGLHDPDHYSTPHEIALILEYALEIPQLREIISTYRYTTAKTEQHPDGLLLTSTVFSRMRGDEPGNAEVFAGKTGYTHEAKSCLASAAETPDGRTFVLVTAYADGTYAPVYDAIDIYRDYIPAADAAADAAETGTAGG